MLRTDRSSQALLGLLIAALASGDAMAGSTSGRAPRRTLGAAYARNRAVAPRPSAAPARGAAQSGGDAGGLGSSRRTARPHAPAETAAPARPAAPRVARTRAEARAFAARHAATQAAERAAQASGEAETAFAEHAGAERAHARAEAAAQSAAGDVRTARTAVTAARTNAGRARRAVRDAEEEVTARESLRDSLAASKPRKGNALVNAFMAPFRAVTGSRTARQEWNDALALAEADIRSARGALTQARRSAAPADDAVAAAESTASVAERAAAAASAELDASRGALSRAHARLTSAQRTAGTVRSQAAAVDAEAVALEETARVSIDRIEAGRARVDQHRLRLSRAGVKAQERYRTAARSVKLKALIESKPGEVSQDAIAAAPEAGLYAIADGVTHSDFSGPFARALVRRWTEQPPAGKQDFDGWLADVQAEWKAETDPIIEPVRNRHYNRGKTWVGHAAFVGARLEQGARGARRLKVIGTGDTVALLVRGGTTIEKSFPLSRAEQFSDVVEALPSSDDAGYRYKVVERSWPVQAGDEVFMATDALAAWIFGEVEAGRDPFPTLRAIRNQRQMTTFVTEAREGRVAGHDELHVDDTALLHFTVPSHNNQENVP